MTRRRRAPRVSGGRRRRQLGQRVQIECSPSANNFSMHMVGTPVDVTAIRVVSEKA